MPGSIGATVHVFSITDPVPGVTTQGQIGTGDTLVVPLTIPAGTAVADFRLGWRENWGQYPTNDLDLFLVRPDSTLNFGGATLNSPEHVVVNNPAAGQLARCGQRL